jgi:hypothetical protein
MGHSESARGKFIADNDYIKNIERSQINSLIIQFNE